MENENMYLPVDLLNFDKVVIYEKWIRMVDEDNMPYEKLHRKVVLLTDNNVCHKYCGFNKFTKETYQLPSQSDGWVSIFDTIEQKSISNEEKINSINREKEKIRRGICDPTSKLFDENQNFNHRHDDCKLYKIIDNYNIAFLVYINENTNHVYVYGKSLDVVGYFFNHDINLLTNKIVEYDPIEIFIGESLENEMTKFSGGFGDKWKGNSILLRIGSINEFRYVYIGAEIYEFSTDEIITKYVSSVGNNCVPYPYAESLNWCYAMSEASMTPIGDHPNRNELGSVSYIDSAKYIELDYDEIYSISSNETRYEHSPFEEIPVERSIESDIESEQTNCNFIKLNNTCNDDSLALVQQISAELDGN